MSDHSDLIERLRDERHCNDWYLRQEAASALSSQSLSLSEAVKEIERLKRERDHWKFGHDAFERQHGEVLEALRPFVRPLRRSDPVDYPVNVFTVTAGDMRRARSALEDRAPGLADATNDPADLSSLRKGAEVAVKPLEWINRSTERGEDWRARTPWGWVEVFAEPNHGRSHRSRGPTQAEWLSGNSADALKEAIQHVYETRIRSALVSGSREDDLRNPAYDGPMGIFEGYGEEP